MFNKTGPTVQIVLIVLIKPKSYCRYLCMEIHTYPEMLTLFFQAPPLDYANYLPLDVLSKLYVE